MVWFKYKTTEHIITWSSRKKQYSHLTLNRTHNWCKNKGDDRKASNRPKYLSYQRAIIIMIKMSIMLLNLSVAKINAFVGMMHSYLIAHSHIKPNNIREFLLMLFSSIEIPFHKMHSDWICTFLAITFY